MPLNIELPAEVERKLSREAARNGVDLPRYAAGVLERSVRDVPAESVEETAGQRLLDILERLHAEVPPDTWHDVPTDLARNYKHYLYGHPKTDE